MLHISCLTKLLTTRPPAFPEIAGGAHTFLSCTLLMQWQNVDFSQLIKTPQATEHQSTCYDLIQWMAQEKMLPRCISLFSTTTKRDPEGKEKKKKNKENKQTKKNMFVDATPAADGNKRRLKLVAFCITKPKLHLRSTLSIIVFK